MSYQQYSPSGFRLLPPVVKNLLIINGLFYLATITFENTFRIDLVKYLGLYYFGSDLFSPYQFITYMFMHGSFPHILYNMFALWMFGYLLENVWGPKRFLTYYVITGIGAALVQMFITWIDISSIQQAAEAYRYNPDPTAFIGFVKDHFPQYHASLQDFITQWSMKPNDIGFIKQSVKLTEDLINLQANVPTVGASGAVYGILLAFGMMFPNMLVYIYFLFPIKAKWLVIFYGAIELFGGLKHNPSDNVAHFAHLGGMIFGFFLIRYWKKRLLL